MSEETTETTEAPKEEPKGLRATIDKQAGRIKELESDNAEQRATIMTGYYDSIGLDPSVELGKAIAKEYDGPATLEGLAAFAKDEYDYVPEEPLQLQSPEGQVIAQGHNALDQIGQTAGSVPVAPTEGGVLAEAEAKGDYATTMAIKGQQMADMMRRK